MTRPLLTQKNSQDAPRQTKRYNAEEVFERIAQNIYVIGELCGDTPLPIGEKKKGATGTNKRDRRRYGWEGGGSTTSVKKERGF